MSLLHCLTGWRGFSMLEIKIAGLGNHSFHSITFFWPLTLLFTGFFLSPTTTCPSPLNLTFYTFHLSFSLFHHSVCMCVCVCEQYPVPFPLKAVRAPFQLKPWPDTRQSGRCRVARSDRQTDRFQTGTLEASLSLWGVAMYQLTGRSWGLLSHHAFAFARRYSWCIWTRWNGCRRELPGSFFSI